MRASDWTHGRRDESKFSNRLEDAAKARAEMLAKAKARAEAAKAGADDRTKERLAIAAAREERQKQRAEEKRLAAIEAEKNKVAIEAARKKAEEEAKIAAAKAAEEAKAQKAREEAEQKAARDAKYAARKERGKKEALGAVLLTAGVPVARCSRTSVRSAWLPIWRQRPKLLAPKSSRAIIGITGSLPGTAIPKSLFLITDIRGVEHCSPVSPSRQGFPPSPDHQQLFKTRAPCRLSKKKSSDIPPKRNAWCAAWAAPWSCHGRHCRATCRR